MYRVMIVDDHPVVISGLRAILESRDDFKVTGEASDARQAVNILLSCEPDIIIADVELGCGLNGFEFVRKAREMLPGIRILVMSIDDGALYAERAIKSGARGFISKVDLTDNIFTAIETVKSGKLYLSSELCAYIARSHFSGYFREEGVSVISALTDRELEIFHLMGRGYKRDEIAEKLNISISTLETHRRKIRKKLSIPDAPALTKAAIQHAAERFNIQP